MSKEYLFEFHGTRDDFLNRLTQFHHSSTCSGSTCYYFDDYIVKIVNGEIHFGVARGGHSGGYWFVPKITDTGDRLQFRGKIQYIGPDGHRSPMKKLIDRIGNILLFIFFLPIILMIRLYMLIEHLVRKLIHRPKTKEKTSEERLFDLMENYFGCTRK